MENLSPEKEYILKMTDEQIHALLKIAASYADMAKPIQAPSKCEGNAYQKLNSLIGLQETKETVKRILAFHKVNQVAKARGHAIPEICKHMVFLGNPGTAKTTVARLFAAICKEQRILKNGVFVEANRVDIISKYMGNTAEKVKKLFDRAEGGVLFIDEAYSLVGEHNDYGEEAINTINVELENRRDRLIVIFAGYPEKMKWFIESNPGLKSRIMKTVYFPDYTVEELEMISESIAEKNGYRLEAEAKRKISMIMQDALSQENFGNGRYSRKLIENAMMNHAYSISDNDLHNASDSELFLLHAEDITPLEGCPKSIERRVGFG